MSKIWNRIKTKSEKIGGGAPIWSEPNQPRMTIGALVLNPLQDMELVSAGTPLEYDYKLKQAKFLKAWEVTTTESDTITVKVTKRSPELYAGINVMKAPDTLSGTGTAAAITKVVENAEAGTAILTVAGLTVAKGDFLVEAAEAGSSKSMYAIPNGISIDDTLGGDVTMVGIARGMKYLYENTIPAMPQVVKNAIPFVEWDWFNQ